MKRQTVYLEQEIQSHPRIEKILAKLKPQRIILCESYQEIFNRKGQSFRLQKNVPSIILAKKRGKLLHEIPKEYGIGGDQNYYFSHLLNCPFDCQYCFLQGLYPSANFVHFINYEDFQLEMTQTIQTNTYFFSGYDADSLAMEATTSFFQEFYPFFFSHQGAYLELRTKSLFIKPLLNVEAISNVIVAYTLSPEKVCQEIELKAPPLHKRLDAITALQKKGWLIGLRFDPIMNIEGFEKEYRLFFEQVFQKINLELVHSVTLGSFRLPKPYFKQLQKNMLSKHLLAPLQLDQESHFSYQRKDEMLSFCRSQILKWIPSNQLFVCQKS